MVADLASAGGQQPLVAEKETVGGWSFEKHWNGGKAVAKIADGGRWDTVVLQEHSMGALTDVKAMEEYAAKLVAEVLKQGAKPIFYQTWARQGAIEKQGEISKVYLDLGKRLKAEVAPVGMAWELALKSDPALVLHVEDKSHPNLSGSYLAACVFYGVIYKKSPEGLPGKIGGMSDEAARKLQAIAWKTVCQVEFKN
jgi:hypothetical protein